MRRADGTGSAINCNHLAGQFGVIQEQAGHVAARLGESRDETAGDRIGLEIERDDR